MKSLWRKLTSIPDRAWEISYLVIFAVMLTYKFLITTMFDIPWPGFTALVRFGLIAAYTAAKLILQKRVYKNWEWICGIAILIIFAIPSFVTTDYRYLIEVACFIVAAKGVDFDKILRVYIVITFVLLVITMLASYAGLVEDLVYVVEDRGERHSFGIIYPTDFAAHWLYLAMAWMVWSERLEYHVASNGAAVGVNTTDGSAIAKNKSGEMLELQSEEKTAAVAGTKIKINMLRVSRVVIPALLAVFVYAECRAYTSVICFVLLAIVGLVGSVRLGFARSKGIPVKKASATGARNAEQDGKKARSIWDTLMRISLALPVVLAGLFVFATKMYERGAEWAIRLNHTLSERLDVSARAFLSYPLKLFGQTVEENGFGGKLFFEGEYFFLDVSYVRMLIGFGIAVFAIILALWIMGGHRAIKAKRVMIPLVLIVLSLQCVMEHHILEFAYNVFLLLPFAYVVGRGNAPRDDA